MNVRRAILSGVLGAFVGIFVGINLKGSVASEHEIDDLINRRIPNNELRNVSKCTWYVSWKPKKNSFGQIPSPPYDMQQVELGIPYCRPDSDSDIRFR